MKYLHLKSPITVKFVPKVRKKVGIKKQKL